MKVEGRKRMWLLVVVYGDFVFVRLEDVEDDGGSSMEWLSLMSENFMEEWL